MKKLLSILFALISLVTLGQQNQNLGSTNTIITAKNQLLVDSALRGPLDTLASAPIWSEAYKNGTKYYKGSDGHWHTLTSGSTTDTTVAHVLAYGADPTGISNSATAFIAAIATKKPVIVDPGKYLITGSGTILQLNTNQRIYGYGKISKIVTTSNATVLGMNDSTEVSSLYFVGSGKAAGLTNQTAIYSQTHTKVFIRDVWVSSFSGGVNYVGVGGGAIVLDSTLNLTSSGNSFVFNGNLTNVFIDSSNTGLVTRNRAEYFTINNSSVINSTLGHYNSSGNITWTNGSISHNNLGIHVAPGTNNGHSSMVGLMINHNDSSIVIDSTTVGYSFGNCEIFYGFFRIRASSNINIIGGQFSNQVGTLTGNTALCMSAVGEISNTITTASGDPFSKYGFSSGGLADINGIFHVTPTAIGMGTLVPDQPLHLSVPAALFHLTSTTGTNRVGIYATNTGGSLIIAMEGSAPAQWIGTSIPYAALFGTTGNHCMQLITNSSTRMFLDSAGNIGVGINTPQSSMHLHGSTAQLQVTNATTGSSSSTSGMLIKTSGAFGQVFMGNASHLELGVGNTEKWRIANGGQLSNTLADGTAYLTLKDATNTTSHIILGQTAGALLTTPVKYAIEHDSLNIDWTDGSGRRRAHVLAGYNQQTGTTYSPYKHDVGYFINMSNTAARTVSMPAAAAITAGYSFTIKDEAGTAGTAPITINRSGSDVIDGQTSIVINQNYGSVTLYSDGSTKWYTVYRPTSLGYLHTIFTPTTGGTVNLINNQYNIINPAGTLLALTVNLPSSPNNNDVVYIKYTQSITTVTYANGTVVDGITGPAAGGLVVLTYDSGTTSWY